MDLGPYRTNPNADADIAVVIRSIIDLNILFIHIQHRVGT